MPVLIREFQETAINMIGRPPVVTERRCFLTLQTPIEAPVDVIFQLSQLARMDFSRLRRKDIALVKGKENPAQFSLELCDLYADNEMTFAERILKANSMSRLQGISFALQDNEQPLPSYNKLAPVFAGAQG